MYFEQGQSLLASARNLLVVGAALKIFGVPMWWIIVLTPPILIAHILVGWIWLRWGWLVQRGEVPLWDKWTPMHMWDVWMRIGMLKALNVDLSNYDLKSLPEEFQRVLASMTQKTK